MWFRNLLLKSKDSRLGSSCRTKLHEFASSLLAMSTEANNMTVETVRANVDEESPLQPKNGQQDTITNSEEMTIRREWPWKKAKKVAVMLSFSGKNYFGMQRNIGFSTIEEELLKAFRDSGAIAPEWFDNPQKGFFQRASRTDKGVSAAKMIISLKMLNEADTIPKVNALLPPDIRIMAIRRVTKNFDSKNSCDGRTYLYVTPTFAFCPVEQIVTEEFRMDERTRERVNEVLKEFVGVHYYHNYTSGKLPLEPSSQRMITEFEIGEPFIRKDMEFAVIKVKGQSFMLHQIRKMIGMTIAVVRGHASIGVIKETWKVDRIDVPRAPGLGLLLEEVHYDRYNKRFGTDGIHLPLKWDDQAEEVEKFKEEFIYSEIIDTEIKEKSMFEWMNYLPLHTFQPRHFESDIGEKSPLRAARRATSLEKISEDKE